MNLETLSAEARQTMIAQTPLGRLGKPEDIAEVVTFLVSDQCERLSQIQTIPKSRGKRNQH